ncbi:MAG: phenylalanine--tRNA ligase subunit beta [Holosporales bacterium]|jgi:phenylalanyl-tRNA synthetase beta chain|nr:phenylalanine--tRNA ligase subunit beta [Holosporales bacterium]
MKFSYSWLKDHLDTTHSPRDIADKLNDIGFEVDELEDVSDSLRDIAIARVEAVESHPNADRLHVCRVFDGKQTLQIVCGAPNVHGGMNAALVHVGGFVPALKSTLKEANIRGVVSQGMLCSAEELQLSAKEPGIMDIKTDVAPGEPLAHALGLDDPIFTIVITPNRGDCFSVRGIARELAAAGVGTLKALNYAQHFRQFEKINMSDLPDSPVPISVETPQCRFFIGATMSEVINGFSPHWMQKRLLVAGQRPIDVLVDITNFLNFDIGQPLHVYDSRYICNEIHVRRARDGEQLKLLNGQICECSADDMLIADNEKPLTLAGVMGGEQSGSSLDTTDIFVEAAYFDPVAVTLTGQRHILQSESRTRFERGIDPEMTPVAMEWALSLVKTICGGNIHGVSLRGISPHQPRAQVSVARSRIVSLSGDASAGESGVATAILERLGFKVVHSDEESITIAVPSWRHDVSIDADLVEEILRMRGYANLPIRPIPVMQADTNVDPIRHIKNALCNRGMSEVYTLPFLSGAETEVFEQDGTEETFVEILKPLNADMAFLQKSLVQALLKVVAFNKSRSCNSGAIFEVESVFAQTPKGIRENKMVCGGRFGMTERNWLQPARDVDVYDVKADLLELLAVCNIESYQIERDNAPAYCHPQRFGRVVRGKDTIGWFGELHPKLFKSLERPIVLFETIVSDALVASIGRKKVNPFVCSKLQPISRDFAFIVGKDLPANSLITAVKAADARIASVKIFDVFEGKLAEDGKVSIALEVVIQPRDSTMTDSEIQALSQSVISSVLQKCNGQIRSGS